jgi:hypothetical protein
MKKVINDQLSRQDYVDGEIYRLIQSLNPTKESIAWNIEMIGEIRDSIQDWSVGHMKIVSEQTFYPFIEV